MCVCIFLTGYICLKCDIGLVTGSHLLYPTITYSAKRNYICISRMYFWNPNSRKQTTKLDVEFRLLSFSRNVKMIEDKGINFSYFFSSPSNFLMNHEK